MCDFIKVFFIVILCFIVTSCVNFLQGNGKARNINIKIIADNNINYNVLDTASPVAITIYQFSSTDEFSDASYQQITADDFKGVLAKRMAMIWPGKTTNFDLTLNKETKVILVIADYRVLENKQWKLSRNVNWLTSSFKIRVTKNGIREN